VKKSSKKN